MYTILQAYGIEKSQFAQWGWVTNAGDLTVIEARDKYRRLQLRLQLNGTSSIVEIDLFRQVPFLDALTGTLSDIFATWTNEMGVLENEGIQEFEQVKATYFDLSYAGYKVDAVTEGGQVSSDLFAASDLLVSRQSTDVFMIDKYLLFNINGFFYQHERFGDKIVIPNAARSLRNSRHNLTGAVNFEAVGETSQHAITAASIMPATQDRPLSEGVLLKLPVGSVDKGVLIVIGGYLHALDFSAIVERIDDETVLMYPRNMNLVSRYAESRQFLELGYQLPAGEESEVAIDEDYLYSDEALTALFTSHNSFFVVCESSPISSSVSQLHSMKVPGRFLSAKDPDDIMIAGFGYVMNYWKIKEGGLWGQHAGIREVVADNAHQQTTGGVVSFSYRGTQTDRFPQAQVLRLLVDKPV